MGEAKGGSVMDNYKAVYRILSFLEKSEQYDEFDGEDFNAEYFGLTDRQWASTLERMTDDGYIKGVVVRFGADGYPAVSVPQPRITSKGLEYLQDNAAMRKASNAAKGVTEAGLNSSTTSRA
jgi:hypothetical protein